MKKLIVLLLALSATANAAIQTNLDRLSVGTYLYPKSTGLPLGSSTLKWAGWFSYINGEPAASVLLPSGGTTTQYLQGPGAWATLDTSAVPENGSLYYTNARARAALDVTGSGLGYDATGGYFSCVVASGSTAGCLSSADWTTFNNKEPAIAAGATTTYLRGDKTAQTLDTSVVPENGSLYYTDARARAAFSAESNGGITYTSSTGGYKLEDGSSTVVSGTDVDWSLRAKKNGPYFKKITGDTTLTFSNVSAGCIQLWVSNSGSYSLTLPAAVKFPAGATTIALTAGNKTDVLTFCSNGDTTIVSPIQNYDFN